MQILYQNETEDYGNDCMIYESILLLREFGDLKVRYSIQYKGGWVDERPNITELTFKRYSDELQKELDDFCEENSVNSKLRFEINDYID